MLGRPQEARFCEECATPLARTCSNCRTVLSATAKFCHACAHPVAAAAGASSRSPDSYTPKHLADKILTAKAALEGKRKLVTVLFADLKGSMELLADRDPEEARKILDPVIEHMMDAVHRYEGTVNQVMGDGSWRSSARGWPEPRPRSEPGAPGGLQAPDHLTGTARVRLARLERQATRQLAGLQVTATRSRDRVTEAVESSHRRLRQLMRTSEPAFRRALQQAREFQGTADRTRRGLKAGLRAGREAYRRSGPR